MAFSTEQGPLGSALNRNRAETRPFYALSPVFQVPSMNANRLSPTGAPHPGKITSNTGNGIEHRVKLLKNGQYRIDVKGSERSQPGGTIDNPRVKIFAGSSKLKLLNKSSNGVSQNSSETRATGGGAGENSRLDIKAKETDTYDLLVHRADGDNGTYTITVTNLGWPDGRRAPDITVDQENRNNVEISWTKSKKSQSSLLAPPGNYEIEYRTLSGGSWSYAGTVDESARDATITSLARTTAYEVRVRMIPPPTAHTSTGGATPGSPRPTEQQREADRVTECGVTRGAALLWSWKHRPPGRAPEPGLQVPGRSQTDEGPRKTKQGPEPVL